MRKILISTTPAMPGGWQDHKIPHGAIVSCALAGGYPMLVTDFGPGGTVICGWVNGKGARVEWAFPWAVLRIDKLPDSHRGS